MRTDSIKSAEGTEILRVNLLKIMKNLNLKELIRRVKDNDKFDLEEFKI